MQKVGHIIEAMVIEIGCSMFTRVMLVVADDTGKTSIFDGDVDQLVNQMRRGLTECRMAIECGDFTQAIKLQRALELKRDVLTVMRQVNSRLQAAPKLPNAVRSLAPFTEIIRTDVAGTTYVIVGHEDGLVSLLDMGDLAYAERVLGRSKWPCIFHPVPSYVHDILVPMSTGFGYQPVNLPIATNTFTPRVNETISIRTAFDPHGGCWLRVDNPVVQLGGRIVQAGQGTMQVPTTLATRPVDDWPFSSMTDFVEAAVDAAKRQ